jgi:hypothetical protein
MTLKIERLEQQIRSLHTRVGEAYRAGRRHDALRALNEARGLMIEVVVLRTGNRPSWASRPARGPEGIAGIFRR